MRVIYCSPSTVTDGDAIKALTDELRPMYTRDLIMTAPTEVRRSMPRRSFWRLDRKRQRPASADYNRSSALFSCGLEVTTKTALPSGEIYDLALTRS